MWEIVLPIPTPSNHHQPARKRSHHRPYQAFGFSTC
nr:MAG TPA: hypothetical protein [Bacteriophage sp.]